jgi:hypothetical protein
MNNPNFEFKSYIPTPTDQYMLGLAKVKLYGKVIATYKHVKTKDGTGTFFCTANYTMTDAAGEKKYQACIMLDSRDDEEELLEFIRRNVNAAIAQKSAHKHGVQAQQPAAAYYPHGMVQNTQMQLPIAEVGADDPIPF